MPNHWKERVRGYVNEKIERKWSFLLLNIRMTPLMRPWRIGQRQAVHARRDAVQAERDRQRRETEYYQSARFFPRNATRYDSPQRTRDPQYAERVAHQQHYFKPTTDEERYRFAVRRSLVEEHDFFSGYDQPPSRRDYHRYPPAPAASHPPVHPWGSTPYYQQYVNPHRDIYRPSPAELMRAGGYTSSIQEMRSRRH